MEGLAVGILLTVFGYSVYPICLIVFNKKIPEKKIWKKALWNSVIVYILFCVLHLFLDGETANATAACTWFFIVRWVLKKKCLDDKEETRLKSKYGKLYSQLLKDSIPFYSIKRKVSQGQIIEDSIVEYLTKQFEKKIVDASGKEYANKLKEFVGEVNWEKLAKEIDLDTKIDNGEPVFDEQEIITNNVSFSNKTGRSLSEWSRKIAKVSSVFMSGVLAIAMIDTLHAQLTYRVYTAMGIYAVIDVEWIVVIYCGMILLYIVMFLLQEKTYSIFRMIIVVGITVVACVIFVIWGFAMKSIDDITTICCQVCMILMWIPLIAYIVGMIKYKGTRGSSLRYKERCYKRVAKNKEWLEMGIISQEEYEENKTRILKKIK